jgi:hypothetical protein
VRNGPHVVSAWLTRSAANGPENLREGQQTLQAFEASTVSFLSFGAYEKLRA